MAKIDKDVEHLQAEILTIRTRLRDVENKQEQFNIKFVRIEAQKGVMDFFTKNWWKLAIAISPIVAGIGELMVYLRNLPTTN